MTLTQTVAFYALPFVGFALAILALGGSIHHENRAKALVRKRRGETR